MSRVDPLRGFDVREVSEPRQVKRRTLSDAKQAVEHVIKEEGIRADARVAGSGRRIGLKPR